MQKQFVIAQGRLAVLRVPLNQATFKILRDLPDQQGFQGRDLRFIVTDRSVSFIDKFFPGAEWDATSRAMRELAARQGAITRKVTDFAFRTKPFAHQEEAFLLCRDAKFFALLMEQGTGKTKVTIDNIAWLYAKGEITGVLIVAPNGVHRNWVTDELPVHMPEWTRYVTAVWSSRKGENRLTKLIHDKHEGLRIFCINIEALSTPRGAKAAEAFMLAFPSMAVVDEASTIKTPKAKRTKSVQQLGRFAPYRRILTGTIVTKSPLDVYEPFRFLDEDILGFYSFVTFRSRYAVMKALPGKVDRFGRPIQVPVGYMNLEELHEKIKKFSYRKLKSQCLDLPPKLYKRRPFQMSDEQWDYYKQMDENLEIVVDGRHITAPLPMTKQLRLAQIACGYLPTENPDIDPGQQIGKVNRRLEALLEDIEPLMQADKKIIIVAPWRAALRDIFDAIRKNWGSQSVIAYGGQLSKQTDDQRADAKRAFQQDDRVRVWVGNDKTTSMGHTLNQAAWMQFYCMRYDYEVRVQCEDRPHRIGQTSQVLYTDYEAQYEDNFTTDRDVIYSMKRKREIADTVNGDDPLLSAGWLAEQFDLVDREFEAKYK